MDHDEHDGIIRTLVQIAAHQDTLNERLTGAIERLDVTQARIEILMARMLRHEDNWRESCSANLDQRAHLNKNLRFRPPENSWRLDEPNVNFLNEFFGRFSTQNRLLSAP